jgi:hypothetical protein
MQTEAVLAMEKRKSAEFSNSGRRSRMILPKVLLIGCDLP